MEKQKIYSKADILSSIVNAAKLYHDNLEKNDLLIIYKNSKNINAYEISFLATNFQHFTGTKTKLNSVNFYKAAKSGRLRVEDFEIKNSELTSMKIDVLENAMTFCKSARMIGIYTGPKIQLEADVGAGNVQCVMTFRYDDKKGNNWLYPVGVNKEDVRDVTTKSPIVAILRKNSKDSIYKELTYCSKNINLEHIHIPKELKAIISNEILQQIDPMSRVENVEKGTRNIIDNNPDIKKEKERISMKEKLPEMKEKSDKLFGQGQSKQQDLQYKNKFHHEL